jgi:ribosome-binding factor A
MSQRLDRVDELLRQEIGAIIAKEVSDPRIGFVTVTKVETTPDLSMARVWVSVIGTPEERKATMRALEHAMPFVRRLLGDRIRIRRIPVLHVRRDETIERGTRILKLIDDIESGVATDPLAPEEPSGATESLPTPVARLPQEGDAPAPEPEPGLPIPPAPRPRTAPAKRGAPRGHSSGARAGGGPSQGAKGRARHPRPDR